jgi:glyoxylate reductase
MRVLITGRLPDVVLARVEKDCEVVANRHDRPMPREEILASISDKDGLLCMITDRVDKDLITKAPKLKIIANYGVGFNNIDIDAASENGILVSNTPGVLTDSTADLAIALMLASARRLIEGDRRTRSGQFKYWAPLHFLGYEVTGKTLGIIGLGRIGKAVAKRAAGFDMKVIYFNRNRLERSEEKRLNVEYADFSTLLETADFISLHVPLSHETKHLIGPDEIQRMKSTAFLINTSRGPVVDEKALIAALYSKEIRGAGLDVYENEPDLAPGLSKLDNVVLLPHVGSATVETRTKMASMAAENLLSGLRGEVPVNCLNYSRVHSS